jgi:hypothetical protein
MIFSGAGNYQELEEVFRRKYGYAHAVWFPYGRVAMQAFLECVGGTKSEVVVSPFNCVAVGNAILSAGAHPVYVDTEEEGFNQDPRQFASALKGPEVKAGIIVSLWGIPPEVPYDTLPTETPLLHDYALRSLDFRPAPLRKGDGALYSLNWGKPIPSMRGAFLCTHWEEEAGAWRKWREGKFRPTSWRDGFSSALLYKMALSNAGFNLSVILAKYPKISGRFTGKDAESADRILPKDWNRIPCQGTLEVGLRLLNSSDELAVERHHQVERYHDALAGFEKLILPPRISWLSHFPIRTPFRESLRRHLFRCGVFTSDQLYAKQLSDFPWLAGRMLNDLPHANRLAQETLHLPLFSGLSDAEQRVVIDSVREFFQTDRSNVTPFRRAKSRKAG